MWVATDIKMTRKCTTDDMWFISCIHLVVTKKKSKKEFHLSGKEFHLSGMTWNGIDIISILL